MEKKLLRPYQQLDLQFYFVCIKLTQLLRWWPLYKTFYLWRTAKAEAQFTWDFPEKQYLHLPYMSLQVKF